LGAEGVRARGLRVGLALYVCL